MNNASEQRPSGGGAAKWSTGPFGGHNRCSQRNETPEVLRDDGTTVQMGKLANTCLTGARGEGSLGMES